MAGLRLLDTDTASSEVSLEYCESWYVWNSLSVRIEFVPLEGRALLQREDQEVRVRVAF